MRKHAEIARCKRNSPRRVEPWPILQAADQLAVHVEDRDVPKSGAMLLVRAPRRLFRKGNHQVSADILDAEWSICLSKAGSKRVVIAIAIIIAPRGNGVEVGVVHLDPPTLEIRRE